MEKKELLEKLKNDFQMSIPKDITSAELCTLEDIITQIDPDLRAKTLNKQIIEFNNKKLELNDNKTMKKRLETTLEDLDLLISTHRSKIFFCLQKAGINTVYDIVRVNDLEKIENLDPNGIKVINKKLLDLGINIDDKEQCKNLIIRYNQEKNMDIVRLMETDLYDLNLSGKTVSSLKRCGIGRIIDVLNYDKDYFGSNNLRKIRNFGEKSEKELKEKFLEYGIDYDDREQRQELIDEYNSKKIVSTEKEMSNWQTELDKYHSSQRLEDSLKSKENTLYEMKKQLRRKESLQQQLLECDKEFNRLVEQYNLSIPKESGNSHGTK